MYRVEYGPSADERLQDRLDRMVAAMYPTMCMLPHQVYGSGANQSLDEGVRVSVSLAWELLTAVDASITREAAKPDDEEPATAEQQARDQRLDTLVARMRVT